METVASAKILNIKVSTKKKEEILKKIITGLKEKRKKFYIVTPNPEIMMYAMRHKSYQRILNEAEVSLPDGVGVLMASKMLKRGVKTRITGVDFMIKLASECAKEGLTVGFLGGRGNVAEMTADCLVHKYPDLRVGFVDSEWGQAGFEKAQKYRGKNNNTSKIQNTIDILFVAFGFPKQEEWIAKNLPQIPVTAAMGVGGAFDYISGSVKRAPNWAQNIGLEWLFRLINEPWRWRRQLALPKFMYYVVKEKLSS